MKNTIVNYGNAQMLFKNGVQSQCPFKSRIPTQTSQEGPLELMYQACDSFCPHFDFDGKNKLGLTCGGSKTVLPISGIGTLKEEQVQGAEATLKKLD